MKPIDQRSSNCFGLDFCTEPVAQEAPFVRHAIKPRKIVLILVLKVGMRIKHVGSRLKMPVGVHTRSPLCCDKFAHSYE